MPSNQEASRMMKNDNRFVAGMRHTRMAPASGRGLRRPVRRLLCMPRAVTLAATLLGAPVDLFAGLGFIAVFAGATNTPLACTVMGIA